MSKPYDATTKALLGAGPDAWLALAGLTADGPVTFNVPVPQAPSKVVLDPNYSVLRK